MALRSILFVALVASGCVEVPVGSRSEAIVYGEDGREEPYESDSPVHAEIARSQVAVRIVDWAVDRTDPSAPTITYTRTLGESEDLCAGEPFFEQIAPGSCSATLIDDRHLLTAGHCASDSDSCTGSRFWVFGFYLESSGELAPLDADDVYSCARVVAWSSTDDYAIIELDRDVVGRSPAELRFVPGGLDIGTRLSLIGFPNGVPAKIDRGGVVTDSVAEDYFVGTVDAFDSSSGSGVFDDEGRLLGILQRGGLDYVLTGGCAVVNTVETPAPGTGEVMAYVNRALIAYCASPGVESELCACDGPCIEPPVVDAGVSDAAPEDAGLVVLDAGMPAEGGCSAATPTRGAVPAWLLICLAVFWRSLLWRHRGRFGGVGRRRPASRETGGASQ